MKGKRQNDILKILVSEQSIKTEELAEHFGVSIQTIRRDIHALENAGLIKKIYGGITLPSDSSYLITLESWNTRQAKCNAEKVKIAARTLELIPDNSIIALDIGTTTYELSKLLSGKTGLSIITNSMLIASEVARNTPHKVYCIGGMVGREETYTCGVFARAFVNNFNSIDYFIGSADGFSPKSGITECNEQVVDVKSNLIAHSSTCIMMVDHSKFGKEALFVSCPTRDVDILVTDDQAPAEDLEKIEKLGTRVIIAK